MCDADDAGLIKTEGRSTGIYYVIFQIDEHQMADTADRGAGLCLNLGCRPKRQPRLILQLLSLPQYNVHTIQRYIVVVRRASKIAHNLNIRCSDMLPTGLGLTLPR